MTRNNRVMFVDDEEGVRVSWQRFLQDRGLAVATAPDGASAIAELSRQPVDVVVSDLRMPGTDGLELLKWLHDRQPTTRFILFTGYGDAQVERRARELGASDYLEKPVSPDVLAHAIDVALDPGRLHPVLPVLDVTRRTRTLPSVRLTARTDAASRERTPAQTVGLLVAAPFLGLAFVVFLPVIGLGALAWVVTQQVKGVLWPARP
ncbi:MAG: response regulator [Gemmatimonadales bacterium]|nr:MAG: response regulator [Gemmatimonadales bacterium]